MSYSNPTKSQVLKSGKSDYSQFYHKGHHLAEVRKFMNSTGKKPTLDDSQVLLDSFTAEWGEYYDSQADIINEKKQATEFYRLCVPLRVDVVKAVTKFMEGREVEYPMTFIKENNMWNSFKIFVNQHRDELKHIPTYSKERVPMELY